MTLTDHLEELRFRILWSLGAWIAASIFAYSQVGKIFAAAKVLLGNTKLIFTAPTEAFFAYLELAMVGGLFLAAPVIFYHALRFVVPGLEPHERKWLFRLMPVAILLFAAGCCFAYFVVLPVTLNFFMSFQNETLEALFKMQDFVGFVVGALAICGVIFQLPLILLMGAIVGIVKSSALRRHRRMAYFLAFVVAAVATPTPDAMTASVVALPIIVLFELSTILIRLMGK